MNAAWPGSHRSNRRASTKTKKKKTDGEDEAAALFVVASMKSGRGIASTVFSRGAYGSLARQRAGCLKRGCISELRVGTVSRGGA